MHNRKLFSYLGACKCLFDLILYVPSTIFQLYRDESSWVEPVLSLVKCVLLKDHNAVTPPVNESNQYEPLIRLKEQSDLGPYSLQYKLI